MCVRACTHTHTQNTYFYIENNVEQRSSLRINSHRTFTNANLESNSISPPIKSMYTCVYIHKTQNTFLFILKKTKQLSPMVHSQI